MHNYIEGLESLSLLRNFIEVLTVVSARSEDSETAHMRWSSEPSMLAYHRQNNEPRHEISNNVVCATSKGSDQPAHMHSLFRAFTSRLNIP